MRTPAPHPPSQPAARPAPDPDRRPVRQPYDPRPLIPAADWLGHDGVGHQARPAPPSDQPADQPARINVLSTGVGLARLTVGTSAKLGRWGLGASLRIGNRVIKAAVSGESATTLLDDATHAIRDQARDLLGLVDDAGRMVGWQRSDGVEAADHGRPAIAALTPADLRARGAALLDAPSEMAEGTPSHPAHARMLDELAPDEARIVRLLAVEGPQPAVDVRTYSPFPGGSELIAGGLHMIATRAVLHHADRTAAYLANLMRLGLVVASREPLADPLAYQPLEAQADVVAALGRGRTKVVRRSIQITAFGQELAEACFPLT